MSEPSVKRYSARYFPSRESAAPSGHAFLLARDIPLGVMPASGSRSQPSFKVELTPADPHVSAWLTQFLQIDRYAQHSLDAAVSAFVETSASYIGYSGEVTFEILFDAQGEIHQLDPLPPGRVFRGPRRYFQVIPKADREQFGARRSVRIPRGRIWRLTMPSSLGGPRRHRRLLRYLEGPSFRMPQFVLKTPDFGRSVGYDFSVYRDASDRLKERATKHWGTVLSMQRPVGPSTEYFYVARRLAFLQAQAKLREHTIAELNRLLERLGVPHSILVSGIPTEREIATTLDQLHRGDVTFAEAFEAAQV